MEKNYTRNQMLSKASERDVSSKQFSKQNRRRENNQNNPKNNQDQSRVKPKNYKNFNDRRPPPRRNYGEGPDSSFNLANGQATGLNDPEVQAELHSVFVQGSKKQNLNHLLNFHYNPRESSGVHQSGGSFPKNGFHQRNYAKKYRYNKEQYLQANCQFVVKSGVDYRAFKTSPDLLVDWDHIEQVIVSSCEESICPICLYPPKASKICKCGHIYCYSCMLHYLSLSDKNWRKCPICYEAVHLKDLKSAVAKQTQLYKVGDPIFFNLMRREKGCLSVSEASRETIDEFPNFSDSQDHQKHSKLILADHKEVLKILEQEKNELEFQMIENGEDCPESVFVEQAREFVLAKEMEVRKSMESEVGDEDLAVSLNPTAEEFIPVQKTEPLEDPSPADLFDEDCNLTINDIDIMPTQSNQQSKYFFYYQAADGQNIFLHSVNTRMLQEMYGCLEKSPQQIKGRIVQIESCSLNEDLRKRLKYLQHLPVTSQFDVVEIEFEGDVISNSVMNLFRDEIRHRAKNRQRREREERKREREIDKINDRQMGKMMSRSANIDIGSISHFPACGDFQGYLNEMPALDTKTSVSSSDGASVLSASPGASQSHGPSFARMLVAPKSQKPKNPWPTLGSDPQKPHSQASSSFFQDKKLIHASGSKNMLAKPQLEDPPEEVLSEDDDQEEKKVPLYKNNLGDALASALSAVQLNPQQDGKTTGGKKKKAKKTLFVSGMAFGGI